MKDLKLSLIIQALDRATAPLRNVANGLKGLEARAGAVRAAFHKLSFTSMLGSGLAIGAVASAGGALFALTNRVAEMGEGFLHAGIKAGTTAENMQRLGFAAKQLGVDQDGLSAVFFRFQTHLQNGINGQKETVKALNALGISAADAGRLAKDPHEAFLRLVDGFSAIKDPTLRAKLALDLFSRSGYQILPMLTAGRAKIAEFEAQLDAAHAVMSTADAEASEKFIQNKNRMGLALDGLQMRIGVGLIPVMSQLVDKLTAVIVKLQPAVVKKFTEAMGKLVDQLPALINLFSQLLDIVAWLVPKLLNATEKVGGLKVALAILGGFMALEFVANVVTAAGAIGGLVKVMGLLRVATIVQGFIGFAGALIGLIPAVGGLTGAMTLLDVAMDANPVGLIVLGIAALIAACVALGFAVYAVIKNWAPITAFFGKIVDGIKAAWGRLPGWFRSILTIVGLAFAPPIAAAIGFAKAVDFVKAHWSGLTRWFQDLMDAVARAFSTGWAKIWNGMPAWAKTLTKVGAVGLTFAAAPALAPAAVAAAMGAPRAAAAAAPHGKLDITLHNPDGKAAVKSVKATGIDATISRGGFPG
jgi:hypothetical protein